MRLGVSLHFKPSRVLTVRELLAAAHIDEPKHHFEAFRDDFEEALDALERDHLLGRWKYVDEADLPDRKWLDLWLDWRLEISEGPTRLTTAAPRALPARR